MATTPRASASTRMSSVSRRSDLSMHIDPDNRDTFVPIGNFWTQAFSGRYSVKTAGAKGNGVTDDRQKIADAQATLVADGGGYLHFPRGTYKVGSDLTLGAANIIPSFAPGATINPDAGVRVTLGAAPDNGPVQVFGGEGEVVFDDGAHARVLAEWFGIDGINDTPGLQAAAYSIRSQTDTPPGLSRGGRVLLQAKEYILKSPLVLPFLVGMEGHGRLGSVLQMDPTFNAPNFVMVEFTGSASRFWRGEAVTDTAGNAAVVHHAPFSGDGKMTVEMTTGVVLDLSTTITGAKSGNTATVSSFYQDVVVVKYSGLTGTFKLDEDVDVAGDGKGNVLFDNGGNELIMRAYTDKYVKAGDEIDGDDSGANATIDSVTSLQVAVRLGDPRLTPFDTFLRELRVDCNHVIESVGVHGMSVNELGGLDHVQVTRFSRMGVWQGRTRTSAGFNHYQDRLNINIDDGNYAHQWTLPMFIEGNNTNMRGIDDCTINPAGVVRNNRVIHYSALAGGSFAVNGTLTDSAGKTHLILWDNGKDEMCVRPVDPAFDPVTGAISSGAVTATADLTYRALVRRAVEVARASSFGMTRINVENCESAVWVGRARRCHNLVFDRVEHAISVEANNPQQTLVSGTIDKIIVPSGPTVDGAATDDIFTGTTTNPENSVYVEVTGAGFKTNGVREGDLLRNVTKGETADLVFVESDGKLVSGDLSGGGDWDTGETLEVEPPAGGSPRYLYDADGGFETKKIPQGATVFEETGGGNAVVWACLTDSRLHTEALSAGNYDDGDVYRIELENDTYLHDPSADFIAKKVQPGDRIDIAAKSVRAFVTEVLNANVLITTKLVDPANPTVAQKYEDSDSYTVKRQTATIRVFSDAAVQESDAITMGGVTSHLFTDHTYVNEPRGEVFFEEWMPLHAQAGGVAPYPKVSLSQDEAAGQRLHGDFTLKGKLIADSGYVTMLERFYQDSVAPGQANVALNYSSHDAGAAFPDAYIAHRTGSVIGLSVTITGDTPTDGHLTAEVDITQGGAVQPTGRTGLIAVIDGKQGETAKAETADVGQITFKSQARIRVHLTTSQDWRPAPVISSGTTTGPNNVAYIEDSGADFVTDGVKVGDYAENTTKSQFGHVTQVVSATRVDVSALSGGGDFDTGDGYEIRQNDMNVHITVLIEH